jgi:hypothetical protein
MHTPSDLPGTIPEAVFAVARRAPERVAMQIKQQDAYRQCTYKQLVEQVEELAAALMRHDLRRGDRVAIVAENRPEWVIAYLGIVAAGGTAVPLDIQLRSGDLARLLERSGAQLVYVSATTWPLLRNVGLPRCRDRRAGLSGSHDRGWRPCASAHVAGAFLRAGRADSVWIGRDHRRSVGGGGGNYVGRKLQSRIVARNRERFEGVGQRTRRTVRGERLGPRVSAQECISGRAQR